MMLHSSSRRRKQLCQTWHLHQPTLALSVTMRTPGRGRHPPSLLCVLQACGRQPGSAKIKKTGRCGAVAGRWVRSVRQETPALKRKMMATATSVRILAEGVGPWIRYGWSFQGTRSAPSSVTATIPASQQLQVGLREVSGLDSIILHMWTQRSVAAERCMDLVYFITP